MSGSCPGDFVEEYDSYRLLKDAVYGVKLKGLMSRAMPSRQSRSGERPAVDTPRNAIRAPAGKISTDNPVRPIVGQVPGLFMVG